MSNKKWILQKQYSFSFCRVFPDENEIGLQLLYSRGIKNIEERRRFFEPDYGDLYDPFLIASMDKAVERIAGAISENEKIIIFGDYDADGICASAVFNDFFDKIGFKNFEVYIPDCYLEGHGLNDKAIDSFAGIGANLIITADCGSQNNDEVLKAKGLGIDVIITDHHPKPPDKTWPDALAVVNPRDEKSGYPFGLLTGAGVAFKVVSALVKKEGFAYNAGWEKWLLDAAAIGTIADLLPLVDENRILIYYGLKVLRKTRRLGLRALCRKLGLNIASLNEDDVAFSIAPHINSASRMDHAVTSFLLLKTDSEDEAEWLSSRLAENNKKRKLLAEKLFSEVRAAYDKKKKIDLVVAGKEDWQPGILPVIANKLLDEFGAPVFVWGRGESELIRGSCRSGTANLVEIMKKMPWGFFEDFGGHPFASGFSFNANKLSAFEEELKKAFLSLPPAQLLERKKSPNKYNSVFYEREISVNDITWQFLENVDRFRPFGMENPSPIFILKNIVPENVKTFGNGGLHIQLDFRKTNNEIIRAIGFFSSKSFLPVLDKKSPIDLAFSVEKSNFKGYDELRLKIADLKEHER